MAELKEYAADPEVQRLHKEGSDLMGGRFIGAIKILFFYVPHFFGFG
jgi:hypothetical protein